MYLLLCTCGGSRVQVALLHHLLRVRSTIQWRLGCVLIWRDEWGESICMLMKLLADSFPCSCMTEGLTTGYWEEAT